MAAVSNLFESQLDRKLNKHIDKQDKGKSLHYSYDSFNSIAEVSRQLILWPRVSVIACLLSQSDCTCSFHHFKLLWLGLKKKKTNETKMKLSSFFSHPPPLPLQHSRLSRRCINREKFSFLPPSASMGFYPPFPGIRQRVFLFFNHSYVLWEAP